MYNRIVSFFLWLFPIVKQAAIQVLAEEIHKIAYPNGPMRRRTKVDYSQMRDYAEKDANLTRTMYDRRPRTLRDVDRLEGVRKFLGEDGLFHERNDNLTHEGKAFHDTLMVAFDISGPDARSTHEWLREQMPTAHELSWDGKNVYLDDWWIANDERFSLDDRDSAVFVSRGNQAKARALLREHGLVD